MNARDVRSFLLQQPRASLIRLSSGDGVPQEIKIGNRSLARIAETIVALEPERIELLDKDGAIIRALRWDHAPEAPPEPVVPPIPAVLAQDPESARLTHFANLLAGAYRHSTQVAFDKIAEFLQQVMQHTQSVEHRLEMVESDHRRAEREAIEAERDHAEELAELMSKAAGGDDAFGQQMAQMFMQGVAARQQAQANGASNGKAAKA